MTDLPADWAIEKALVAGNAVAMDGHDVRTVADVKRKARTHWSQTVISYARLIEQTQPAPVDRKLLVAREAAARYYDGLGGYEIAAGQCREGLNDEALPVVVEAINLWESGYAA